MADFLTDAWFDELNQSLEAAGSVPMEDPAKVLRIVFSMEGGPATTPHALTFTLRAEGARVEAGDHLAADTLVRLAYDDALALSSGTFDSATALREGRLKVRGDINNLVPLLSWLQQAHRA